MNLVGCGVGPKVLSTRAAWYSKKYRYSTRSWAKFIPKFIEEAHKHLEFDPKTPVIFKPLRGSLVGLYSPHLSAIFVHPSKNNSFKLMTLCLAHEFVHAEQHHQGRLRVLTGGDILWKEQLYPLSSVRYNMKKLPPWEVEAYGRQTDIAIRILEGVDNGRYRDSATDLKSAWACA